MPDSTSIPLYCGVDVGTGSARAAFLDGKGNVIASASQATKTWRDPEDHRIYEQSTEDIWAAITFSVKSCLKAVRDLPAEYHIEGIGFDATCSLAVVTLDTAAPVCVSKKDTVAYPGEPVRNVILWADHRAKAEAEEINATQAAPLAFVGGTMSLEMELPKTLWLKRNMPEETFSNCEFFDLPDYLTFKATGNKSRSVNSLGSKYSYIQGQGWDDELMNKVGLGSFRERNYIQLGPGSVLTAGAPVGAGLDISVAEDWGLSKGLPVGSAVIDAYAGWIGSVASKVHDEDDPPAVWASSSRLCAIAGTSTCHIVQSQSPVSVTGVWGPYKDACVEDWFMSEGGQSCTGQLLEFVLKSHQSYPELKERALEQNRNEFVVLADILEELQAKERVTSATQLIRNMNMYPDMHGNRSPLADNCMRGMLSGLSMDSSIYDLARKYQLALESIALQTKHIVSKMNEAGHQIRSIYMSGGQVKNRALMQLFADVCNIPVILPPSSSTSVVAGAAILGRYAAVKTQSLRDKSISNADKGLWQEMTSMTLTAEKLEPSCSQADQNLLHVKYKIFLESIDIQRKWRSMTEKCDTSC